MARENTEVKGISLSLKDSGQYGNDQLTLLEKLFR